MQFSKGKNDNVCLNKCACKNSWMAQLILPITGMLFLIGLISTNLLTATAATDANQAEPNSIIAEGAQVKLVSNKFSFTDFLHLFFFCIYVIKRASCT